MSQSRKRSVIEVTSNTAIGFVGSWCITFLVLQYVSDSALAATIGTLLCIVWSLLRGYAARRHFARAELR